MDEDRIGTVAVMERSQGCCGSPGRRWKGKEFGDGNTDGEFRMVCPDRSHFEGWRRREKEQGTSRMGTVAIKP